MKLCRSGHSPVANISVSLKAIREDWWCVPEDSETREIPKQVVQIMGSRSVGCVASIEGNVRTRAGRYDRFG